MLKNWEDSEGTIFERAYAIENKIPVFYEFGEEPGNSIWSENYRRLIHDWINGTDEAGYKIDFV